MPDYDDSLIHDVLETSPRIVLVGASANPERDSFKVMAYLLEQDYQVHPVNPGLAGQTILGQTVYASLAEVPGPVEMVDIFRNAEAAGGCRRRGTGPARAAGPACDLDAGRRDQRSRRRPG